MDTTLKAPGETEVQSSIASTVNSVKEMFTISPQSISGLGIGAVLAKTALKRLPAPLNVVVPMAVEKVILKYGVPKGREALLTGLRWVKKATDEQPEPLV